MSKKQIRQPRPSPRDNVVSFPGNRAARRKEAASTSSRPKAGTPSIPEDKSPAPGYVKFHASGNGDGFDFTLRRDALEAVLKHMDGVIGDGPGRDEAVRFTIAKTLHTALKTKSDPPSKFALMVVWALANMYQHCMDIRSMVLDPAFVSAELALIFDVDNSRFTELVFVDMGPKGKHRLQP